MDGHRSYSIHYFYSWRWRLPAVTPDLSRPYPLSYDHQSRVGSSGFVPLHLSNWAIDLLPRSTISMGKARTLGLSTAKCKGERILQEISWPFGAFFFSWRNSQSIWLNRRLQRLMDPPGSAYRSETGGLMEALRCLTPDQSRPPISWMAWQWLNSIHLVRQYHSTYYAPHNLSLIVTGKLSSGTASLLDVVQEHVEPSIIAHGQDKGLRPPGWKRPFLETDSAKRFPVTKLVKETVEFPEKDESRCFKQHCIGTIFDQSGVGELVISFLGPVPNHFLERKVWHLFELLGRS